MTPYAATSTGAQAASNVDADMPPGTVAAAPERACCVRFDGIGRLAALASAEMRYEQVGATQAPALPTGYGHVHRDVSIGYERESFDKAVAV
jgi:hypothetical protein